MRIDNLIKNIKDLSAPRLMLHIVIFLLIVIIAFSCAYMIGTYNPDHKHPCDGNNINSKECQQWKRHFSKEFRRYKLQRDEDSIYLAHPSRLPRVKDFK